MTSGGLQKFRFLQVTSLCFLPSAPAADLPSLAALHLGPVMLLGRILVRTAKEVHSLSPREPRIGFTIKRIISLNRRNVMIKTHPTTETTTGTSPKNCLFLDQIPPTKRGIANIKHHRKSLIPADSIFVDLLYLEVTYVNHLKASQVSPAELFVTLGEPTISSCITK